MYVLAIMRAADRREASARVDTALTRRAITPEQSTTLLIAWNMSEEANAIVARILTSELPR